MMRVVCVVHEQCMRGGARNWSKTAWSNSLPRLRSSS